MGVEKAKRPAYLFRDFLVTDHRLVPKMLELLVDFLVGEDSHSHVNCSCSAHQRSIFSNFQEKRTIPLVHRPRFGRQLARLLQVILLAPRERVYPSLHDISTTSL